MVAMVLLWKALLILVGSVVVLQGLLPEFHQSDWDIKHHILEVVRFNKTLLSEFNFYLFTHNRTVKDKLINGTMRMRVNGGNISMVSVSVYKQYNTDYRPFPINLAFDICEEFKRNTFGIAGVKKHSNFQGCPFRKGFYYISNYRVETALFPPHIPTGRYRVDFRLFLLRDIPLADLTYYGEIYATKGF